MNTHAITQNDIAVLRQRASKKMRLVTMIVVPGFAVLCFVVGLLNLCYCSRFAEAAGLNMTEVIRQWFEGVDTSAQYSGMHIMAMGRWVTGITEIAVGVVMGLLAVVHRHEMKRSRRLLEFLEAKLI